MRYFVVDAFADQVFSGNPAGVCLVENGLPDETMQSIAFENNLAETAFLIKRDRHYDLRWFTPTVEIDLCGHATLASAFVIMECLGSEEHTVDFHTKSGVLRVARKDGIYFMDFPARKPSPCAVPAGLEEALGEKVLETHMSRDLLVLLEDEKAVFSLSPDIAGLKKIKEPFAFIVTAPGSKCDFVSRFFAPNAGIDEDPVTGSSHSTLIPFWSGRLNKKEMTAAQLSKRGGTLYCRDRGERVEIGGRAACYLRGEILL